MTQRTLADACASWHVGFLYEPTFGEYHQATQQQVVKLDIHHPCTVATASHETQDECKSLMQATATHVLPYQHTQSLQKGLATFQQLL